MKPHDSTRCTFLYQDGRRCRMLRSHEDPPFCLYHFRCWLKRNDIEPSRPRPLAAPGALDTPWAVRRTLKELFRELADGHYTPEQARVLASLGRLLLVHTRRRKRRPVGRPRAGGTSAPGKP